MRKQKGITLIALVITIIVLIILAGVSITALTDEDKGVVTKAKKATTATTEATAEEDEDVADLVDYAEAETKKRQITVTTSQTERTGNDFDTIVTLKITLGEELNYTLDEKKQILARMLDCENWDQVLAYLATVQEKISSASSAATLAEATTVNETSTFVDTSALNDYCEQNIDLALALIGQALDFENDLNEIESWGVPVITVTTPYGTKLYTTAFAGVVSCGIVKNGTYDFNVRSGMSSVTETVTVTGLVDRTSSGTHKVKLGNTAGLTYRIDDSTTQNSGEAVVEINDKLTVAPASGKCYLNCIEIDEEFYKNFSSVNEWRAYFTDNGHTFPGLYAWIFKSIGCNTYRQGLYYVILAGNASTSTAGYEPLFGQKAVKIAYHVWDDLVIGEWPHKYELIDRMEEEFIEKFPFYNMNRYEYSYAEFTPINITEDTYLYLYGASCFTVDTYVEVEVWDDEKKRKIRIRKKAKDVTYDDDLVVWDFDKGEYTTAKPLWIMKTKVASEYNLLKFSDGSELKTVFQHRIFNKEAGCFTYPMTDETPIGTTTYTADGKEVQLVSKEKVTAEVEYINIITKYHMNLFAGNVLTSCGLNNIYPIEDMKFVKDGRDVIAKSEFDVPEEYYEGLRLGEHKTENDEKFANDMKEHVENLIASAKEK